MKIKFRQSLFDILNIFNHRLCMLCGKPTKRVWWIDDSYDDCPKLKKLVLERNVKDPYYCFPGIPICKNNDEEIPCYSEDDVMDIIKEKLKQLEDKL